MIRGGGNGRAELRLGGGEALLAVVVLEGVQVEVLSGGILAGQYDRGNFFGDYWGGSCF